MKDQEKEQSRATYPTRTAAAEAAARKAGPGTERAVQGRAAAAVTVMDDILYDIANGELPPGTAVKCGNRAGRPKKQRVHHWQELGPDQRNDGAHGFVASEVRACQRCGADSFRKIRPRGDHGEPASGRLLR